jgi:hypothetical protein
MSQAGNLEMVESKWKAVLDMSCMLQARNSMQRNAQPNASAGQIAALQLSRAAPCRGSGDGIHTTSDNATPASTGKEREK